MQLVGQNLVLSATDLTKHLACPHITTLDQLLVEGKTYRPKTDDDELELIFALGLADEAQYLAVLRAEGRSVSEIEPALDTEGRRAAEVRTVHAMHSGVSVIYQATFVDETWGGQADFLLRTEEPSGLGAWSYEIADTKLARRLKVPALLQMAVYARRLGLLQGKEPERLWVVTGDGVSRPWRLVDVAAYAHLARERLEQAVRERPETGPVPVAQCGQCRWIPRCASEWKRKDDLSLVAFMRADHRLALIEAGVATLAQLAGSEPEDLPRSIGRSSRERLVGQARQQLDERDSGRPSYTLLAPAPGMGLLRLPAPNPGDLYLDFEGDPYANGGEGREFLAGISDRSGPTRSVWAHDQVEERRLTEDLVDLLLERWRQFPEMHVYHYGAYESTAFKRLTARHGTREAELDQLLRGQRLVDLYAIVRQGMRISKSSYSIKKMEAFYWSAVRSENEDVAEAMSAVLEYERWLVDSDQRHLDAIDAYNRDDVRSTLDLHDWLEERREEVEGEHGSQPRPSEVEEEPKPIGESERYEADLAERLRTSGYEVMAGLVQYHRREARPAWWEVFRLGDLDDDELVDDGTALGRLSGPTEIGVVKKSHLYEYSFPSQDTRIGAGEVALDVDTHRPVGTVVEIDGVVGRLVLKRASEPLTVRALGPPAPYGDAVLRDSIHSSGEEVLAGEHRLADCATPTEGATGNSSPNR